MTTPIEHLTGLLGEQRKVLEELRNCCESMKADLGERHTIVVTTHPQADEWRMYDYIEEDSLPSMSEPVARGLCAWLNRIFGLDQPAPNAEAIEALRAIDDALGKYTHNAEGDRRARDDVTLAMIDIGREALDGAILSPEEPDGTPG